ncbi:AAA family ATPase [Pedobacter hartonius]|uniref:Predicted ATPase n=1 Tax=Pedobacter hartonius TaxID=425514 RepID=A0A1H4ARW9_9SPHI|nr:AAA family ATPase [Pedobacter hartonius]SEA38640.1 Predicted ATPase [Pedobacter hartonius]
MQVNNKRYVITGGPGSGKSTLIEGLEKAGYACSAEISREMIKAEVAKGSDCLPWLDISCFSDKVIARMTGAWQQSAENTLTFFDRGIPDVIAYLRIAGLPMPQAYLDDLLRHPYENQVFILPPWEAIYVNDAERWQSFEESGSIYDTIRETYTGFGFELTDVPKIAEADRVAFVLNFIK